MIFLDTNVLIYAVTDDPKAATAQQVMHQSFSLSVQTLTEFANVLRRKLRQDWTVTNAALTAAKSACRKIWPIDAATHDTAMRFSERYGFAIYDALLVAVAFNAGGSMLLSEDMHDGLVVEDRLTIRNPFANPSRSSGGLPT